MNDPPDLNAKRPFGLSVSDPLPPPSTRLAVRPSPLASLSFVRTPGALTVRLTPVVATYESFAAVGAVFLIVNVTVAGSVRRIPRLRTRASYVNASAPTYPALRVEVKLPFALTVTVPCAGFESFAAVIPIPLSLPRTPEAATDRTRSWLTEYESS